MRCLCSYCKSDSKKTEDKVNFFILTSDPELKPIWIKHAELKNAEYINPEARICSVSKYCASRLQESKISLWLSIFQKHFEEKFIDRSKSRIRLFRGHFLQFVYQDKLLFKTNQCKKLILVLFWIDRNQKFVKTVSRWTINYLL